MLLVVGAASWGAGAAAGAGAGADDTTQAARDTSGTAGAAGSAGARVLACVRVSVRTSSHVHTV